jgi:hypothetical protein
VEEVTDFPTLAQAIQESLAEVEARQLSFELTMMLKRAECRCYELADSEEILGYRESAVIYRELAGEVSDSLSWAIRGVARAREKAAS